MLSFREVLVSSMFKARVQAVAEDEYPAVRQTQMARKTALSLPQVPGRGK